MKQSVDYKQILGKQAKVLKLLYAQLYQPTFFHHWHIPRDFTYAIKNNTYFCYRNFKTCSRILVQVTIYRRLLIGRDGIWARILVQVTIYRRLLIGRDGPDDHDDRSTNNREYVM